MIGFRKNFATPQNLWLNEQWRQFEEVFDLLIFSLELIHKIITFHFQKRSNDFRNTVNYGTIRLQRRSK